MHVYMYEVQVSTITVLLEVCVCVLWRKLDGCEAEIKVV